MELAGYHAALQRHTRRNSSPSRWGVKYGSGASSMSPQRSQKRSRSSTFVPDARVAHSSCRNTAAGSKMTSYPAFRARMTQIRVVVVHRKLHIEPVQFFEDLATNCKARAGHGRDVPPQLEPSP